MCVKGVGCVGGDSGDDVGREGGIGAIDGTCNETHRVNR